MNFDEIAERIINGGTITQDEAIAIATSSDDELLDVMGAAFKVRRHFHGKTVKVHVLQNAKSGVCPEDCKFCSQSLKNNSDVPQYGMQGVDELVEGARRAADMGAVTYCMVTATRGPSSREIETVTEAVRRIKSEFPDMGICASLGLLKPGQAEKLAAIGES